MATDQEIKELEMGTREVEGSLRVFKFPDVLQFLSAGKMSGVLQLVQEDRRVELSFREGKIFNVISNDRYMRLGQMLLYSGHISRDTLNEALELQDRATGTKFLGEILVTHNMIDPEKLKHVLQLQLEDELWELFSWDSGNFRFEQGKTRDPGTVLVELDVAPLLQEGQRRMEQWHALVKSINNSSDVFCVNPEFRLTSELVVDEKCWRVLALVNGRLPVDGIVRLSNQGKFETYRSLDHLLKSDVIVRMNDMRHHVAPGEASRPQAGEQRTFDGAGATPAGTREAAEKPAKGADARGKSGILGGFFGKKKGQAARESAGPVEKHIEAAPTVDGGQHLTDVGLVCAAVNHLIDCVEAETGNQGHEVFANWLDQHWTSCEQRFPRADILSLRDGRVSSSLYDRYIRHERGLTRALAGSHDDALEALRTFWNKLKDFAAESLGDPGAGDRIAAHAARPFSSAKAESHADSFSFLGWKDADLNTRKLESPRIG